LIQRYLRSPYRRLGCERIPNDGDYATCEHSTQRNPPPDDVPEGGHTVVVGLRGLVFAPVAVR
jgi:hypothetical protein